MAFALAFLVIELATIGAAWRWGGSSERGGAGVLLAMVVVTYVGHALIAPVYHTVDPVGLTVDLIGLAGFAWLGLVSRKFWPIWAASLQLLSSSAHLLQALKVPVLAPVYYWMKMVPTVGVIVLLIAATALHCRRTVRARRNSSPN